MLTSYLLYHDMNVQIHVQILLCPHQPLQSGDQGHLILGLDHHQPSPLTPFVSDVNFNRSKQGCLSFSHDSLSNSRTKSCIHI